MSEEVIEVINFYKKGILNHKNIMKQFGRYGDEKENQRIRNHEILINYIEQLQQENKELNKRVDETLKLINEIRNLEYDKFCNYNTYLSSLNDIYSTLKGDK